MTTFTIHTDDTLAEALRATAHDAGTSINVLIKRCLSSVLGIAKAPRAEPSFMRFAGRIPAKDVAALIKFNEKASFSSIDEEMWK